MAFPRNMHTPSALRGQVRCFKCRVPTMAKNGLWHKAEFDNVFLCKSCGLEFRHELARGVLTPVVRQKPE
jgi:hypothetical protein